MAPTAQAAPAEGDVAGSDTGPSCPVSNTMTHAQLDEGAPWRERADSFFGISDRQLRELEDHYSEKSTFEEATKPAARPAAAPAAPAPPLAQLAPMEAAKA